MLYSFDLAIPDNTPEASPLELDVVLVPGTIVRVEVQFPRGCVGLVHTQAFFLSHQVWPANEGGSLAGDGALIAWEEDYELPGEPFGLRLVGWNDDDTFDHRITWRFALREASGPELLVPVPVTEPAPVAELEIP